MANHYQQNDATTRAHPAAGNGPFTKGKNVFLPTRPLFPSDEHTNMLDPGTVELFGEGAPSPPALGPVKPNARDGEADLQAACKGTARQP